MQQVDIRAIYRLLLQGWKWLIVCALAGAILLGCFAAFVLPKKYTSGVSMYVSSLTDAANEQAYGTTYSSLTSAETLVQTYVELLKNPNALALIQPKLSRRVTLDELKKMISLSGVEDTAIMRIQVTADDAQFAADICNAMAAIAPEILQGLKIEGSVKVIGEARPGSKTSPNVSGLTIVGLLVGFIGAAAVIVLRYLLDNTIKSPAVLKERLQVPVLGLVPSFDQKGIEYGKGGEQRA